jgi:hypothetical protein
MACAPPRNHWWHVTYRVTPRGLATGLVPHPAGGFEVELDLVGHGVEVRTAAGEVDRFPLRDGLSVAEFHGRLFERLRSFGVEPRIRAMPYDLSFSEEPFAGDRKHASYDADAARRFAAVLRWTAGALEAFAGRFAGKTSPVQFFWHSFDLALTRFSGRRAPPRPDADAVEREAYSHEVASFGFWPGDDDVRAPAFYAYAAPVPDGLTSEPLEPRAARWVPPANNAVLMYDDVRASSDPRGTLDAFLESAFRAAYARARWSEAFPTT